MQVPAKRKSCMEVTGGRLTCDIQYEMPGLTMQVFSRQSEHGMAGGGEVHYISSCASGRITRMLLADICGSEDVFRQLSSEMRGGLMRHINSIWQSRVVADMGKQFRLFAARGGFATASIATFFAPTRSFVMCNIGNPPPLIYRAQQRIWEVLHGEEVLDGDVEAVETESELEGVFGEHEYRHINTRFAVDDLFVIYGNGFAQSSFPGGEVVGHKRLIAALQDAPHTDPETRLSHLTQLIQNSNPPSEDSTILVCRVTNSSVSLRDNLLAPLRIFRRPQDNTKLS